MPTTAAPKRHRLPNDPPSIPDPLLSAARAHFEAAGAALRRGCAEALITGLHLIALHARSVSMGGVRLSGSQGDGFESAIEEIGIPKTTAYRWMNACRNACVRITFLCQDDDITAEMPAHGSPRWEQWEEALRKLAAGMSLSRLLLGTAQPSTEDHRYDELLSKYEQGSANALELLAKVEAGKYTLAQAVKALGSQEAYDRLKNEGAEKIRKDPVYVEIDEDGRVGGLVMRSLVTLRNAARVWEGHWDEVPEAARKKIRAAWIEVQSALPEEIKSFKR